MREMQVFTGEVTAGVRHMTKRMSAGSIALELYEKITGVTLVPGSLNIQLEHEVDMPAYAQQFVREDHEGTAIIYITPALVNDIEGFAVRNKKAEDGEGSHPKSIVEVISAHNLRETLGLKDGDKVTLQF